MAEQNPVQFDIFQDVDSGKTNVFDLWDCAPKYFAFNSVKDHSKVQTRSFTLNKIEYTSEISPAIFKRDGETVHRIPGDREEFVESAIRRIAENPKYSKWYESTHTVKVYFTITMLKNNLAKVGHTFNHSEVQESLLILRRAGITIRQEKGENGMRNLCQVENFISKFDSVDDENHRYVCVTLHPLVGRGIMEHQFRSLDEQTYYKIKNQLARFLYRRMCAVWTGAGIDSPYSPKLVNFLSSSPRGLSAEMKQNTRAMRTALSSLQSANVVDHWEEEPEKNGRSVQDILFKIYPTASFVKHWKQSHARHKRGAARINRNRLADIKAGLADPGDA